MPTKRLCSIGPALGLVIDKVLLKRVGWDVGTEIELQADASQKIIVLSRARTPGPAATARREVPETVSAD
jgi:hypothetical protein